MLAQGIVDQCLVTGRTTGSLSLFQKVIHQILIKADGNARLAALFGFNGNDAPPLAFAEVILLVSSVFLVSCTLQNVA